MQTLKAIHIKESLEALSEFAAEVFIEIATREIHAREHFSVALSGGSTPGALYSLLASDKYSSRVDWSRVTFFFGDERNVAPDSERSNYRMAFESLLEPLGIPLSNVHRWKTELSPEDAAELYEEILAKHRPIDLVLLGLGSDGHTASLFPNTPAIHETEKLAVANWVEKLGEYRLSMTFPAINESKWLIFLVSGEDKSEAVARVLEGELNTENLPAQLVAPSRGVPVQWILDEAAASMLQDRESLLFHPAET